MFYKSNKNCLLFCFTVYSCVPISYKSIPFYCVSHLHIYPFIVLVVWFMFTRNIVRIEMMVCRLSFSNSVYTYEKNCEKLPRGAKILENFDKFGDFGARSAIFQFQFIGIKVWTAMFSTLINIREHKKGQSTILWNNINI